jgi:hypothetical protein
VLSRLVTTNSNVAESCQIIELARHKQEQKNDDVKETTVKDDMHVLTKLRNPERLSEFDQPDLSARDDKLLRMLTDRFNNLERMVTGVSRGL